MRRARPLAFLVVASVLGGAAAACNFIVEAKLSGTVQTVPEGGIPDAACSDKNPNTACYQCILGPCGAHHQAALRADASVTRSALYEVEQCGCDPTLGSSADNWGCSNVVLPPDAGYVNLDDPAGVANDLRVCITQECMGSCRVCTDLTYKRFPTDTDQPLVPTVNACAACLLESCNDVLVNGPSASKSTTDHCCYRNTVADLWGDCVAGNGCDAILSEYGDGAVGTDCPAALAACAVQSCRSACGF